MRSFPATKRLMGDQATAVSNSIEFEHALAPCISYTLASFSQPTLSGPHVTIGPMHFVLLSDSLFPSDGLSPASLIARVARQSAGRLAGWRMDTCTFSHQVFEGIYGTWKTEISNQVADGPLCASTSIRGVRPCDAVQMLKNDDINLVGAMLCML